MDNISVIETYEEVLSGERAKFPVYFWDKQTVKILLRYAFLEKRCMTREDIINANIRILLKQIKLYTAQKMFNTQYEMVNYAFPELEILPWELKKTSNRFWQNEENRLSALLWLAKKENIDLENIQDVKERLSARKVYDYLGNKALKYSNNSFFEFLNLYYRGRYKEWELVSKVGVWTEDKVKDAVKYLVKKKKYKTREEIASLTVSDYRQFGLEGMLEKACRHSPLIALQIAYPEYNYTNKEVKTVKF